MVTKTFLLLVFIGSFCFSILPQCLGAKCQDSTYKMFGTRTLYDAFRNTTRNQLPPVNRRTNSTWGCTPVHVYMVIRHGARYPPPGNIAAQQNLSEIIKLIDMTKKAKLCSSDINALRNWRPWMSEYDNQNQTKYGNREIKKLAKRFKELLPELFPSKPNPTDYRLVSSDYQRTIASMNAFANVLFATNENRSELMVAKSKANMQVTTTGKDSLIRYAKRCKKFKKSIHSNSSRFGEFNKYLQGNIFERIVRSVSSRLGIRRTLLTPEMVFSMYFDGCVAQQYVFAENGPWCKVFSKKELSDLEYAIDLKEYWFRSNKIAKKMSCDLAKDLFGTLKNISTDNGKYHHSGTFLFGHVTTIMSLIANLNLFEKPETPLMAENYRLQRKRQYRLSRMMPSAGNLAFVLYKCGKHFKVQAFWNEKEVRIPACPDGPFRGAPCGLRKFMKHYRKFRPGSPTLCNFKRICSIAK